MRFWTKDGLKEPSPIVSLTDMANLLEGGHSFTHNRQLVGAIHDLLDSNGMHVAGVNDTLVNFKWNENATIIKDRLVFDD